MKLKSMNANSALGVALILLAVACATMGYGLCMLVNAREGAALPLGIGASLSGLATIFLARGVTPADPAAPDESPGEDPVKK